MSSKRKEKKKQTGTVPFIVAATRLPYWSWWVGEGIPDHERDLGCCGPFLALVAPSSERPVNSTSKGFPKSKSHWPRRETSEHTKGRLPRTSSISFSVRSTALGGSTRLAKRSLVGCDVRAAPQPMILESTFSARPFGRAKPIGFSVESGFLLEKKTLCTQPERRLGSSLDLFLFGFVYRTTGPCLYLARPFLIARFLLGVLVDGAIFYK